MLRSVSRSIRFPRSTRCPITYWWGLAPVLRRKSPLKWCWLIPAIEANFIAQVGRDIFEHAVETRLGQTTGRVLGGDRTNGEALDQVGGKRRGQHLAIEGSRRLPVFQIGTESHHRRCNVPVLQFPMGCEVNILEMRRRLNG